MRDEEDAYRVHLNADPGQAPESTQASPVRPRLSRDTPFCLGILGDFSGREPEGEVGERPNLGSRPLVRVTPDNVLSFAGLSPRLAIPGEGGSGDLERIRLSTFEGFHPDSLFREMRSLEALRTARRQVLGGENGAGVGSGRGSEAFAPPPSAQDADGADGSSKGFLDAVLDETHDEMASSEEVELDDLDGFLRRVVRPHVIPTNADRTEELKAIDGQVAQRLNRVIHHGHFQALESLWRSVVFLLSRIEVTSKLRVYLVDVSRAELESDLLGTDEVSEWSLGDLFFRPLSDKGEELRWAGMIGAYHFGKRSLDIPLLQRIGFVAEAAEVPWFSGADPSLAGCESLVDTPEPRDWTEPVDPLWDRLRGNPEATWISLALPPFLLRPPYQPRRGKAGSFSFREEVEGLADLLWGNPAFLSGIAISRAFSTSGWALRPGGGFSIANLPLHATTHGGVSPLQAPLSHTAAARLGECGLSPVLASQDEAVVRVQGLRSISREEPTLRAWWNEGS